MPRPAGRMVAHRGLAMLFASLVVSGPGCLDAEDVGQSGTVVTAAARSSTDVIRAMDVELLGKIAQGGVPDERGAIGRNKDGYVGVALQRGALDVLVLGLATNDEGHIRKALQAFRYGFDHQEADGKFPVEGSRFGMGDPGIGGEASSAAFFLSSVGVGYRLVLESDFAALAEQDLAAIRPKLESAMAWLDAHQGALRENDREAPNRLVFDALAFTANGHVLHDPTLQQAGERFLDAALALQRSDGVFVEKGGHDSSYQAIALMLLQPYWLLTQGSPTGERVLDAIERGMAWEQSRILPSGEVSVEGNTRTGLGQEQFLGNVKDVSYTGVVTALTWWAGISNDSASRQLAARVLAYGEQHYARSGSSQAPSGRQSRQAVGLAQQVKAKQQQLHQLKAQGAGSAQARKAAGELYKQAEMAYTAGQLERASQLLDQALGMLQ